MARPAKAAFYFFLAILPVAALSCLPAETGLPRKQVIVITDPPGAEVRLNDAVLEQKTPLELDKIPPGSYLITVSKEGYVPLEIRREVGEGMVISVKETLKPETGNLYMLTEPPGAEISVDGEYQGQTPANFRLATGRHNVEAKLQNYRREKKYIDVEYDKQTNVNLKLERLLDQPFILVCPDKSDCASSCHGSTGVVLTSTPDEAVVYLDGHKIGQTPVKIALGVGEYKLRLAKPGYMDEDLTVKLYTPKIIEQEVRLRLDSNLEDMVFIREGLSVMGDNQGDKDEIPVHKAYVNKYYIDKYEVTNAQYRQFTDATGYPPPAGVYDTRLNGDRQPVVGVNWFEAAAYAHWVGKRLPTEAEWERTARGTQGYLYPWGMQWKAGLCNSLQLGLGMTKPVGDFLGGDSPSGTYDMAGNVWEWCADWYDANFYGYAPIENPQGPPCGSGKVIRGGSYMDDEKSQRTTKRRGLDPSSKLLNVGFRCARDYISRPSVPTQEKTRTY